jgi:5'-methylthioadenosine phosphorylase
MFLMKDLAQIGIIGGSGFYSLAENLEETKVHTPYGATSTSIAIGTIGKYKVAFLARHSKTHDLPPHKINFRANIWALHSLGVRQILATSACGSLQSRLAPGDLVILDQFVDRTRGRQDTFFESSAVTHVSSAYPYCPTLSRSLYKTGKKLKYVIHPKGTIVVINGPRFSTLAESLWFTKMGWDVVGMTQYPEAILARELEICYCSVGVVTDWDVGIVARKKTKPVSAEIVLKNFSSNIDKIKKLFLAVMKDLPDHRQCSCGLAMRSAQIG